MRSGSSSPDPLRRARWVHRGTRILGALAVVVAAGWALRPLAIDSNVQLAASAPPQDSPESEETEIVASHFDVVLWPAMEEVAEEELAPAPSGNPEEVLGLELIGVTLQDGTLTAALYDLREDTLREVRRGDRVGPCTVARIERDCVHLTWSEQIVFLSLESDRR